MTPTGQESRMNACVLLVYCALSVVVNRPGVAGAVLHTASLLIN